MRIRKSSSANFFVQPNSPQTTFSIRLYHTNHLISTTSNKSTCLDAIMDWPAPGSIWESVDDLLLSAQLAAIKVGIGSELFVLRKNSRNNHYVVCSATPSLSRRTCQAIFLSINPVDSQDYYGKWTVVRTTSGILNDHHEHQRAGNLFKVRRLTSSDSN